MNRDEGEHRDAGKARLGNTAALRAVVAGYLIYLGVSLVRDMLAGKSAMAPWVAWLCGAFFVLAGAAFGWYTWKRWRAESAQRPPEEAQPEEKEEAQSEEKEEAQSEEKEEAQSED